MHSAADPLMVVEQICRSRKDRQGNETLILHNIDLVLQRGCMTVIFGPSGGGKSTLIRLLNRLDEPTSGKIRLAGRDIGEIDPLLLRRRVALLLQRPFLFPGTVLVNLQRPFHFQDKEPPGQDDPGLQKLLEETQVPPSWLDREASSLSQGQQQRVCLARSLIVDPEVLLLDEPTSSLDRPTADRLADTLRHICRVRGLAALMVTHDLRLAERTGDHLAYLEGGRILEQGEARQMLAWPQSKPLQEFLHQPPPNDSPHDR